MVCQSSTRLISARPLLRRLFRKRRQVCVQFSSMGLDPKSSQLNLLDNSQKSSMADGVNGFHPDHSPPLTLAEQEFLAVCDRRRPLLNKHKP